MNAATIDLVEKMVDNLVQYNRTEEFEELGQFLLVKLSEKISQKFSRDIDNVLFQLERLKRDYKGVELINPNDSEKTNLLPLINKEWFKFPLEGNVPKLQ